ncbi:hypothetical protein RSSM_05174 [Rhodopirellula sallentina SM41]|uniref:Uncharacterized protein n=1 Tax=Rhodopirellula sallentina SM41 TaxID=1263870 RepID=M5U6A4_9BACT|nr:hypothetical protein RSSM_05174 [Rhodopirellula sallentina SM41]
MRTYTPKAFLREASVLTTQDRASGQVKADTSNDEFLSEDISGDWCRLEQSDT